MTRKRIGRAIAALLALMLLLSALPAAAEDGVRVVRVGFFQFDGYHMMDDQNNRSGYGYDFLQYMVGYTNWRYSYIGYDKSWSEMQDMLERGEIDLLTSAQKTEDRLSRFDFSTDSIGTSAAILTTRVGNDQYLSGDYANWSGMRVGMIRGNTRNDGFAAFAAAHGFTYEPVYFDDTQLMIQALKESSSVDAILTSNLRSINDEWIIAKFDSSPFYIMVRKGDTALLDEINRVLPMLYEDNPGLRTMLQDQYYTPDNGDEIAFSIEERAYIAQQASTPLTALIRPDCAPYSSRGEDGAPVGVLSDVARELINRSGLNIELVAPSDTAEYKRLTRSTSVDVIFDAWYNFTVAERAGYHLTAPYLDASVSRLYRKGVAQPSSLALLRDEDITAKFGDELAKEYAQVAYYDSVEAVVDAVSSGRQDAALLYTAECERAIYFDAKNQLASEKLYGKELSFAVAVQSGQSPLLYSILNKCVASLREDDVEEIVSRNTEYTPLPFSFTRYIYNNPVTLMLIVIALFVVAGAAVIAISQARKRKREAARLEDERRRSALLSDALAAAEKAGAAKSQFLSRVSHEMRTPLNAIIGFLALSKGAEPKTAEEYRTNSEIAAKQLLAVINDVLDMSAIESGKMKLSSAPFDFKLLVHSITNLYVFQCSAKGVAFDTELLTPVDEWLVGDQLRVNQILMNLLGNAVKFTSAGSIRLRISQLAPTDGKVFVRFAVADTGCGMSAEMQSRLFRPFEQESAATAQKYGGSGLGLSIVKSLVTMMDGAIKVESAEGAGTTFTVDLPFGKAEVKRSLRLPHGSADLRVLVADDQASERAYIATVLERIGVRHTCVGDGRAALDELARATDSRDPYSICLVDWRMPELDGIEVTRHIRAQYGRELIVIVVSAYEHYQADESAKAAGADLFLSKPLFQSSLFDLFMSLTDGNVAPTPPAPQTEDLSGWRVLLAEDNPMNQMVAEGLVRKFGVACDTAVNGQIAVDLFTHSAPGHYGAILMDIQMPVMDGIEATRAIRASDHPDAASIPIIALTANAFNEDIARYLSSGMNDHVAKPIEPEHLVAALSRAFAAKGGKPHE